ncbi:MAG: hypothetical protein HN919_17775 [Verrucomicrobia bacterium]|jgi:hypothetical protein|nr:hypothetical protein [Verrucomicrobiota bacterium]MBT7068149.1 hypothetical protein [Verrucomicrobiota bacterium]MBT7699067.1 hypothetical protein [Verrucomicrobiota bacterium]
MSVFAIAMMALGCFLVLYTIVFLLRPAKDGSGTKKDSLGCGFVLLAGLVWSLALTSYLHDRGAGFRLGFGGALILPALVTIFRPGRKRIVQAAVLFVVAIVVASSAFPVLKKKLAPNATGSGLESMRGAGMVVETRLTKMRALVGALKSDRTKLAKEIKARGVGDFEVAADDADLMRKLKELAEIDQLLARTESKLRHDAAANERIQSAIRRVERLEQAGELTGEAVSHTELAAIIEEARQPLDEDLPSSVESHLERAQLKELFNQVKGE